MGSTTDTKARALRLGRGFLQEYGFSGFSFQHIADELGIKKPSLYDHFASKEALGLAIIDDYLQEFVTWHGQMGALTPPKKITALFDIFLGFARDSHKLCPLAALLSEINSLPKSIRGSLHEACEAQKAWLEIVIREGQAQKEFRKDISSKAAAESVLALALGSQIMSRGLDDPEQIKSMRKTVLVFLGCKVSIKRSV